MKQTTEIEAQVTRYFDVEWWYEKSLDELPNSEQEHIKEMIGEGFSSGELLYDERGNGYVNRGWWTAVKECK